MFVRSRLPLSAQLAITMEKEIFFLKFISWTRDEVFALPVLLDTF